MNDNLTILFPEQTVKTSIGNLTIVPVPMKHWSAFVKIASRWLAFLNAGDAASFNAIISSLFAVAGDSDKEFLASLQTAYEAAGEQFFTDAVELFQMSSKAKEVDFGELNHAEFFGLLQAIFHKNQDFFARLRGQAQSTKPEEESSSKS